MHHFRHGLIVTCVFLSWASPVTGQRPNILLIMADDLGWSDTNNQLTNNGSASDFFETPALRQLASQGMAFTNAYTSGPNCSPTRAALLTGQYAQRSTNNIYMVGNLRRAGDDTMLGGRSQGLTNGQDELPGRAITLAETLKTANYTTAHFGKYQVGGSRPGVNDPLGQGFDFNFGGDGSGAPSNYRASFSHRFGAGIGPQLDPYAAPYTQRYIRENLLPFANGSDVYSLVGKHKHVSDAMADAAIDFMKNEAELPFFMHFNPYAVHEPIEDRQARPDLLDKYKAKKVKNPSLIGDNDASFAALIEGMDQSIARVIDHLRTTPDRRNPSQTLSENTLVVFYSDNGGRQPQSNNGPLRGQKGELLEGGIRVPMIAWSNDPALVDRGTVNETPVAAIDFYKTFATLARASLPSVPLDGADLGPILADNTADLGRDNLFWHVPGYLIDDDRDLRPTSIVRSGDHKLWYNYEEQLFELYDLENDIAEMTNIASQNPQLHAAMGVDLAHWLADTDAPLALLRSGPLDLTLNGLVYRNGELSKHVHEPITIRGGEEVPFIGDFLSDADLDMNGSVDFADWSLFKAGQGVDMSDLSVLDAFQLGDLDHDVDNDAYDFILFREAYDEFNGEGSFTQLPEPASAVLFVLGLISLVRVSRAQRSIAP